MFEYIQVTLGASAAAIVMNEPVTNATSINTRTSIESGIVAFDPTEIVLAAKEAAEEQEWDRIVSLPHVQQGLSNLAARVRQQIATGKIEEGGFAVE